MPNPRRIAGETKFSTFNPSADWLKAPFVDVLTDTYPAYRGIRRVTEDEVPLALADILRVAIMHRLTDQYGPIPYSEMADPNSEALTAIYDTQQEVYTKMFEELDAAIAVLNANTSLSTEAFGDYDQVYAGNISKWILFANSLKLRMAMRLVYADETTARTKAAEAIAGGVIETNADNAKFQPTLNRTAMIWNDWQDHVISADLISYMNGYEDPRRAKMFTTVTVTETVRDETTGQQTTVEKEVFQGLRIGVTPASAADAKAKCSFPIVADTDPFLWMNAAEVAFLKAEYQLRWGTMSEAGALYKKGGGAVLRGARRRVGGGVSRSGGETCSLHRPAGRYVQFRGSEYHHSGLERRGRCGNSFGTHHHPKVDSHFPAG